MLRLLAPICTVLTFALPIVAVAETVINIHYLRQEVTAPPTLSNLDPIPGDLGLQGAQLGLADNLTTGRFLGHTYNLNVTSVAPGGDFNAAVTQVLKGSDLIILDAPAHVITQTADTPAPRPVLFLNAASPDTALRDHGCRANLLHTAVSLPMRTDALMQFLLKKRWTRLVMVEGARPADQAFAASLSRSATKFGLKIGKRKTWTFDADMRRNASAEVPLFTQDLGKHDVLLIADETGDFGRYIPYNTWLSRPVAGSEGITPTAWSPVVERWGAAQLQSRFHDQAARQMRPRDYAAWAAMRAIGEAVTRTGKTDATALRAYMLSDQFELAGFKGRPLTFRHWNGQLRQPIPLVHPRATVATAPLEGFLHQRTELDSLGLDKPESACRAFDK